MRNDHRINSEGCAKANSDFAFAQIHCNHINRVYITGLLQFWGYLGEIFTQLVRAKMKGMEISLPHYRSHNLKQLTRE